jgi:hypothetical protein
MSRRLNSRHKNTKYGELEQYMHIKLVVNFQINYNRNILESIQISS